MRTLLIPTLAAAALLAGCSGSFIARGPDDYRQVTRDALQTKDADIRACYDAELAKDKNTSGTVVVKFKVEPDTGRLVGAKVDEGASSAPPALGQCILDAIADLAIDPPDAREGDATFTWEFKAT